MMIVRLAVQSLLNRWVTALLTVLAIAVSVMLLLGVEKVRTGARQSFADTISGTDLIVGARDIYLSSISNNLNKIMKTLTIISVVTLPLNVITGFFGMNLDIPGEHNNTVFWAVLLIMLTSVSSMIYLFKKKSWL